MAKEVIKALSLFLGNQKLPAHVGMVEFGTEADPVDVTNGASGGWFEGLPGLKRTSLACELFLENVANPEKELNLLVENATSVPFSATKTYPPAAGDLAYFQKVGALYLTKKGQVGGAWGGSMRFTGQSPAVRGRVLENVVRSATGNSAAYNLAVAVGATERLWVATHVVAFDGTSLDLKVQSDDDSGFPSAVDRVTVPQFTGIGSDVSYVNGAITDTYWRVNATFVGTSVEYLVLIGVAPLV